jgi:4-amino-4-deoxy-L-arabinose transferase-like glycosyltransferase
MTAPAKRPRRASALPGLALGLAYVVALLRTTGDLGYARDEGFYFQAASSYARWFELLWKDRHAAMMRGAVDGAWGTNAEHPGFVKGLFALSNLLLQQKWHLFAMEGTSFRFPGIVLAGAAIALVYTWGARARGPLVGASAAVLLAAMPRFFYHAHLACFDVPIVTMWTLCAYAYWRTLDRGGVLWPVLTGVAFGLALDTKHNAWFLPFALGAHAVLLQVRGLVLRRPAKEELRRSVSALLAMAAIGPVVFYALWPWIWHDTAARVAAYGRFHLNHEYYNMEFLGVTYWVPPMPLSYAWLMTAATVPTVTLALFAVGLGTLVRPAFGSAVGRPRERLRAVVEKLGSTELLWLLGIAANYAVWLRTSTPIFGGTKHWMTAYPFLALFAGVGFAAVVGAARRELFRRRAQATIARRLAASPWAAGAAIGAMVAAAPITETVRSHPWGLSSYTPLVGGAAGAATLGLNRTFWGYTTGSVVDYLNREAPRNAVVYMHDTAAPSWDMLLRDGRLRKDLRGVNAVNGADFALYHHEMHMLGQEYQDWGVFGTDRPDYIAGPDGVPVILVYRRH